MSSGTSSSPVAITALGMVSALGNDVVTSCAAARAGLTTASELKVMNFRTESLFGHEMLDGQTAVFGHVVRGETEGFSGTGKALLLGAAALRDLLSRRPLSPSEISHTGMYVVLTDMAVQDADASRLRKAAGLPTDAGAPLPSASWRERTAVLASRLAEMAGLICPVYGCGVYHSGQGGLAQALFDAVTRIQSGQVSRCLVGGIDSRVEPSFLLAAARQRLLRTKDNPTGLAPGEGAAFFLLERESKPRRRAAEPHVILASVAYDYDSASLLSDATSTGAVLARVLHSVTAGGDGSATWMIGDLNGTERRAMEWGYTQLRLRARHDIVRSPLWLPAGSFGDTGAASGAMGVCMAARAIERGYAPAKRCVVWSSSEGGAKGAAMLHAVGS